MCGVVALERLHDADATGKVVATEVERGSIVKKGQVIVRLDARNAALSERETKALAAAAAAQRKLADDECERSKRLLQSGAISQAEYDRSNAQCAQQTSSALAADTRAQMAIKSFGDSMIRAPYAGLIAERYVSVGEYVLPQTKVAALLEIDPLRLQLTVAESAVPLIKLDQHVDFGVTSYPDQKFGGTIRYLGPALRGGSRDLVVEAIVVNEDHRLRPGMFVTARVDLGDKPLPVVPSDSVRTDGTIHRVLVVVDQLLEERVVQVGETKGDVVAILDGVKVGERVVLHPAESLADGQRAE
jgi:membrane fusion protein (multidrug efflux system)